MNMLPKGDAIDILTVGDSQSKVVSAGYLQTVGVKKSHN